MDRMTNEPRLLRDLRKTREKLDDARVEWELALSACIISDELSEREIGAAAGISGA